MTKKRTTVFQLFLLLTFCVSVVAAGSWGMWRTLNIAEPLAMTAVGLATVAGLAYGTPRLISWIVGRSFRKPRSEDDWKFTNWLLGWLAGVHDILEVSEPKSKLSSGSCSTWSSD